MADMTVAEEDTPYENEDDPELDRRTNEFLRFVVDIGLVDLYVNEDGEFEFSLVCSCPQCEYHCS